ncbi:MAG: urea ABC transporter ATP-binding subunit UrtE [Pseudomonadota bacterium]
MLTIENLNFYYGESHTLRDLNLTVRQGECTCLMGRNGVGKTTLLKCLMGLLNPSSGTMTFDNTPLPKKTPEARAAMGIGYVPQGRQIFPLLTVQENLEIGLTTGRKKQKQVPDLVFELFPVLREMGQRRGGDLSGGQQQQLAIGRALVLEPELLILDEPTEGIQPNIVREIGDIIQRLIDDMGMTVLLVEQKLPFARTYGKRFTILERGTDVANGNMTELDDTIVKQYLTV